MIVFWEDIKGLFSRLEGEVILLAAVCGINYRHWKLQSQRSTPRSYLQMPRFEVTSAREVELHRREVGTDSRAAGSASLMGLFFPPCRCPAAPRLSKVVSSSLIYAVSSDAEASLRSDAEWRHTFTRAYMSSH